jgi:photosystem II stability/assembly factor-like uncharacterized protein
MYLNLNLMKKFLIFLLFFITHYSLFISHCSSQWVQQTLPVGGPTNDIAFFDFNTGIIALNTNPGMIYRTTNGGYNWYLINYIRIYNFNKIDSQVIYANGRDINANDVIYRSFNRGLSWDSVSITPAAYTDLSFINSDTGWICGHNGNFGAIWKTTNGGITLTEQVSSGTSGMNRIFFLKTRVNGEFWGWCSQGPIMRRTTNSGLNWVQIATQSAGNQIQFINKDTGWASNGNLYKSTNGGVNWVIQQMPNSPPIVSHGIGNFKFVNKNIGWGVGGIANYGGNPGVIWATTNGGLNWGYQQPDTSIYVFVFGVIDAIDTINCWAYNSGGNKGIHTTNGGGLIIFTDIHSINSEIPGAYKLYQNYPNPFNSTSIIKYKISKTVNIKIQIFDMTGKEIETLLDKKQTGGEYFLKFDGSNLPSGVYFYTLFISDLKNNNIHKETKSMIYLK